MDELKGLRDNVLRSLLTAIAGSSNDDRSSPRLDIRTAKELIGLVAGWAGKGKDEIVQVLCREIGVAVAAVLREPLTQVLENQKLQVTLEFAPKQKRKVKSPMVPKRRKHKKKSQRS